MTPSKTIDYLCIGHLTEDVSPEGTCLGGTVAYSSLTAKMFQQRTAMFTGYYKETLPIPFDGIHTVLQPMDNLVQFHNVYEAKNRIQTVTQTSPPLHPSAITRELFSAKIVHFGPVLNDFDPEMISAFTNCYIGITPQGWLRESIDGKIQRKNWEHLKPHLPHANAVIISQEDIGYNQQTVSEMAAVCKILVVTEAFNGAKVFTNGTCQHFLAPEKLEVEPTGAGDIFAATFFILNAQGYSPWDSGKLAAQIAANSVTRKGLYSIPTREEIIQCMYQSSLSETK